MALDALKLQESWLYADLSFQEWLADYELRFNKPIVELGTAVMFNELPPEAHEMLKRADPENYKKMQERFGGKDGNPNNG